MLSVSSIFILQLSDENLAAGFHRSPGCVGTIGLAHWDNLAETNQRGRVVSIGSHSKLGMDLRSGLRMVPKAQALPTEQVSSLLGVKDGQMSCKL